jgi:hypothetical protein
MYGMSWIMVFPVYVPASGLEASAAQLGSNSVSLRSAKIRPGAEARPGEHSLQPIAKHHESNYLNCKVYKGGADDPPRS